jgi:hypothetical protein
MVQFFTMPGSSTSRRTFSVEWYPVINADAYHVEVSYSRDGIEPRRILLTRTVTGTLYTVHDTERGGRYYVRVRVKTECDTTGRWNGALVIYFDGQPDNRGPVVTSPDPDGGSPSDDDLGGESTGGNPGGEGTGDSEIGLPGGCTSTPSANGGNGNGNGNPGGNGNGNSDGNEDPNPDHGCDGGNPGQGHA